MPWIDAFIPVERKNRQIAYQNTWGHLAPKKNKTYRGFILFANSGYDGPVLITSEFAGLDDSPWLYETMIEFIRNNQGEDGNVYRFDGAFRNYQFKGHIRTLDSRQSVHKP